MSNRRFFKISLSLVFAMMFWAGQAFAQSLEELIAGAKKEGVIEFHGPSTLSPQGAQALAQAFNKKFGLNIRLNYHPSGNMTGDVAKVISRAATKVKQEWDVMVVTDAHHGSLWLRKLQQPFDYKKLGVDSQAIHYDSGAVSFAHQIILPAYNKNILPAKNVPKRWEDLLEPRWKGKIGVPHSVHHFARLAAGPWGEEKATQFVKRLAAQNPFIGRPAEMYTRLQLGEIEIVSNIQDSFIHQAKRKGAPLEQAVGMEPVPAPAYHVGVLQGGPNPNVAHLFTAFMAMPEVQEIWEKYSGHTSAYIPGTPVHKFAQKYKLVFMDQSQAETVDRLTQEFTKIMGFRR